MSDPAAPLAPALPADYSGPALHAAPPPAAPAAVPVAPPVAVAPPAPAAPPPAPAPAPAPSRDDEEKRASDIRAREKRKALKDEYGTDDEDAIVGIRAQRKKDADDLTALRASKEKADRDQMTEVQRLTTDLDAANKKIAELEGKLAGKEKEVMSSKQEANLAGKLLTHKFIQKPAALLAVKVALKNHFDSLSKTAQAVFVKTGEMDRWLKRFAVENPYLVQADAPAAPAATTPAARPPARPPVRVPAGGARPPVPPRATTTAAPDPLEGKTPLPGRSNSMNPKELKEYLARRGPGARA